MRRFEPAFSKAQARVLAEQFDNIVRRIAWILAVLVVGLALAFGYAIKTTGDSSDNADAALRAAQQVIRERAFDRAADAKRLAEETARKARVNARTAYAACRRQAEATTAQRIGVHVLLAIPDAAVHRQAVAYAAYLQAQHLLDVPECPKPPKGVEP